MRKRMMVWSAAAVAVSAVQLAMAVPVDPAYYTGAVVYDKGIVATANWDSTQTQLSWEVTQQGNKFLYSYEWTTPSGTKDLSHIIIQVSDDALEGDFANFTTSPTIKEWELGDFDEGPSNPDMPGPLYGIKLDLDEAATTFTFSFESTRAPMWGDFYAKDGVQGGLVPIAYNVGFGDDVAVEGFGFTEGDNFYLTKVAVPNSKVSVPDGGLTALLLGLSLLGMGLFSRRT